MYVVDTIETLVNHVISFRYDATLKTSMLWQSKNFLLYKSTTLIESFMQSFMRFHAIKVQIRKSQEF